MLDSLHDVACPPFDQAVAELEAHVRATWQPLGILIAGSIVRGEAGPTSDLDVFVIHDQPWRLRAQRRFAGVPAELFVNPPAQIRRYFASEHAAGRTITGLRLSSAGSRGSISLTSPRALVAGVHSGGRWRERSGANCGEGAFPHRRRTTPGSDLRNSACRSLPSPWNVSGSRWLCAGAYSVPSHSRIPSTGVS